MTHERLIRLKVEKRGEDSYLVSSPDLPLFHLVLRSPCEMESVALPILKDMMEKNLNTEVELRGIDLFDGEQDAPPEMPRMPAHIIAQMAA